jgi:filamentous hemagglutinin family protein
MGHRASLNHIYRTVWNQALGAMVAVGEQTRGGPVAGSASGSNCFGVPPSAGGLRLCALAVACVWGAASLPALANPTGAVVVHGQATQTTNGNQLTVVTQNGAGTKHSAIDWQSFSIPKGSSTFFQQPDANSTVINRVVTNTPSLLFGNLGSNGHVVLVNHTGVTVGAGATVDAASFTASALRMSDTDALAGRLRFGSATESGGNVSVQGSVLARSGDVVLIGSQVATGANALVRSPNGSTVLAAGQQVELTGRGLEGISMLVQAPTDSALNLGTLQGDAVGVFAGTLKTTGTIAATAVSTEGGKVVLKAADRAEVGGTVSALGLAGRGGQVHVTADKVAVLGDALIDVSGERGGGEALIGGGYKGQDARLANARRTSVQAGAKIRADALGSGNGGTVVVWSDQATQFLGTVSARGGLLGGNGGFAEVSGKRFLDYRGKTDLGASNGAKGTLLLDPRNLTITGGYGGSPVVGDILDSTDPGTDSFISASSLSEWLTTSNISLAATNDIEVNQAVTGNHNLTLTAGNAIRLNANIDLTVDPNGYGSPVLSTELNLNAGAGGIVGGAGVITVNRLRISSLGQVLLGASSGVFHRVGNLHFVTPTESGRNLEFRNLGDLALQDITSFGAEVSIAVLDGNLQVAGNVAVGSLNLRAEVSDSTDPALTFKGNITQTTASASPVAQSFSDDSNLAVSLSSAQPLGSGIHAAHLHAEARNIDLGGGNAVSSASFSADVNSGSVAFRNQGDIQLGNVIGRSLTVSTGSGAITQSNGTSVRVKQSLFGSDSEGNIDLRNADNAFGALAIEGAGDVSLVSNEAQSGQKLVLGRILAKSIDLRTTGDVDIAGDAVASSGGFRVQTSNGRINMRPPEANAHIEAAGSITLMATKGLTLGHLESQASGNAVTLVSESQSEGSTGFNAQYGSIDTPTSGRWLVYVAKEGCGITNGNCFGGLQSGFGQYEANYGDVVPSEGDWLIKLGSASIDPLPWLRQQPYGTSDAIVVSYLRNQPTPWPSPLVPTDPVFGQRDRANEGVLVEGEICVR